MVMAVCFVSGMFSRTMKEACVVAITGKQLCFPGYQECFWPKWEQQLLSESIVDCALTNDLAYLGTASLSLLFFLLLL